MKVSGKHHAIAVYPSEEPWYPLRRRLDRLLSQYGQFEEKNILLMPSWHAEGKLLSFLLIS